MVNEAACMIDEGICEAHHAELILKESWGMKQGPLEMADRLGLDLVLSWMEQLQKAYGSRYAPCPLIRRYVREGRLGVKTRLGFLAYSEDDSVLTEDEGNKED
jgi:3-hydroxybutyryl-CoA dehydrogenase